MNDPNRTVLGGAPVADPNRTVMGTAPSLNTTVTIKPVQCPVCKSFNPPGLMFCNDCGLIFELALDGNAFGAPAVQLPVLMEPGGREHQLRPGANVVGRQGDVVVEDTRASRRHCQVTLNPDVITVEDLGSTNGTSVNGERLGVGEKRPVGAGDKVSLGGFELALVLPGEASRTVQAMGGRTTSLAAPPTVDQTVAWLVLPDREVPLPFGSVVFGRRDGNDVVIADPYVSGRHGQIDVTDEGVFLTDLGSTNGTVLNEVKLVPQVRTKLGPDDVVKLGAVEIRFRFRTP